MAETAKPVFTEEQHVALLASAVERETGNLTAEVADLKSQLATVTAERDELTTKLAEQVQANDVLAAEKATEATRATAAEQAFTDYKTQLASEAEVATRRTERVEAIKEANASLGEEYLTEERIERFAQMAQEQFDDVLAAIKVEGAAPAGTVTPQTAAFTGGEQPKAKIGTAAMALFRATGKIPADL